MTVIEEEDVSSYQVTLRKIEDDNKLKVDAVDLSGELSLVEDMNLLKERERNECVCVCVCVCGYIDYVCPYGVWIAVRLTHL